ncbi:hypothetical protein [Gordonia sp. NPDC058843]|uniref:hypothetical protein n=1 Tax=Gordonia sp. NPDC058843 TaxID=3346648 RepID=UPI0036CC7863
MRLPDPLRPDVIHTADIEIVDIAPNFRGDAVATTGPFCAVQAASSMQMAGSSCR